MDRGASWQDLLVASALSYEAGIPSLALDLVNDGGKRALLYGELEDRLLAELAREHVTVTTTKTAAEALQALAWTTFDAVLVVPEQPDGLDVAKALKLGARLARDSNLDSHLAAARHRRKPVFVVPFRGDTEYAVIVAAPDLAYLERTSRHPLARAVARFDATRLLPPGTPDAGAGLA